MLEPSHIELPGICEGHMIEEGDRLLLLSQVVQAMLGMVKDVREGTILKDYEGQCLEACRQIRTGLFIIRIDNLNGVEVHRSQVTVRVRSLEISCYSRRLSDYEPGFSC